MLAIGADCRVSGLELAELEQLMAVVEACLCEMFPDDFFRRCAFSAFGLRALLRDAGVDAVLVGGQFAAFVMTPDHGRLAVQGFRSGDEPHPHYWVEAEDRLVDLGPHLLAFGSDYPVVPMPALAWDMSAPLPSSFRYKAQQRYPADSRMSIDPKLCAQADAFVASCRALAADPQRAPRLPTWLATSYASLLAAVGRDDPWACGARRFEQMAPAHPLPF
ncbi:hypothetical protein SCH01S_17_00180 [Sphingomonas changbaiensis NBRC 104936]|uniref:Uncharacterized protein n=1 Tax=Sphingomonas changbaiensis NBRC 104936 TaxID=1219043 RepID=A0A0E9MMA0_9SPHN|nr:hypothetical protein [Sphingomonas changbaiensis]GAO38664.1 hypothetical protein SCH01S_17_00180 [Sphingomonas changbaiensis NBRC 104936]